MWHSFIETYTGSEIFKMLSQSTCYFSWIGVEYVTVYGCVMLMTE